MFSRSLGDKSQNGIILIKTYQTKGKGCKMNILTVGANKTKTDTASKLLC